MKKTTCIQLVLVTAALAGCQRPFYPQGPEYQGSYYPGPGSPDSRDPYYSRGDEPDSSNSCPMAGSQLPPDYYLWYSGLQPFDFYYGDWFNLEGYYAYRYPATILRAGFGQVGYGKSGTGARAAAHS